MAFTGSRPQDFSAYSNDNGSLQYSTAYNGSGSYVIDRSTPPIDLGSDGYDIQLPPPAKAAAPTRPALGARLLSTLTNAQPAAAALTRKGSVFHSRAKSLAGFVPKLSPSNNAPSSPEKAQQRHPVFGDLFNGESAPVRIGVPQSPTKEETEFVMEYKPTFTERPTGPRRRSTAQTQISNNGTPTKGGWFSRKSLAAPPAKPQDDILALDINSSLFPTGPADPLSPHAFNDLLLNATNLLQRMQIAYKEKVEYIASVRPEIDAQKEEVEAAETRAEHLKLQLEDMSHKAEEQDQVLQEMALQVAEEKLRTQEAREAVRSTIKLVRRTSEGEDDEDTARRRKRGSAGSGSDSGFESDIEYAESVLSSGVETPLSPPGLVLTPAYDGQEWSMHSGKEIGRPQLSRQSTASGYNHSAYGAPRSDPAVTAWSTAERLRVENHDLRRKVEEMQRMLQGCIDFVGSVKA